MPPCQWHPWRLRYALVHLEIKIIPVLDHISLPCELQMGPSLKTSLLCNLNVHTQVLPELILRYRACESPIAMLRGMLYSPIKSS